MRALRLFVLGWRSAGLLACALVMAGCSMAVMDSHFVAPISEGECVSALGGYYLPKKLIRVMVTETAVEPPANRGKPGKPNQRRAIAIDEPIAVPDRAQPFCLDYLESAASIDRIAVERDPGTGLLKRVFTRVTDTSKEIALKALQAVEIIATKNPNIGMRSFSIRAGEDANVVANFTFDPFVREEAAIANVRLTELGFCVYIHGATFDLAIPTDVYCNDPYRHTQSYAMLKAPPPPRPIAVQEASKRGIVYRPNLNQELVVMQRPEPNLRSGRWRRTQVLQVEMPNNAPAFSVEVPRSMFVERKTDVVFVNGTLTDVTIKKPSELESFVDIPLKVAEALTSWPAIKMQVRINEISNQENLIKAQAALLQAQRDYNDMLRADKAATTGLGGEGQVTPRSKCSGDAACVKFVSDCIADPQGGGNVEACHAKYQSQQG